MSHTAHSASSARRGRDIHEEHRVSTPLELLFDLVFVVAIALASSSLHHGIAGGHLFDAGRAFGLVFFAIWWGWMNYTWFASAYDNDDARFRLLTMLQMVGVVIFATGVPLVFQGQWGPAVAGFVVMRLALAIQWLRAAAGDPERRTTCRRYAMGICVAQVGWILRLFLPAEWQWPAALVLILVELSVPAWAERAGGTPWHAHHIAERYGLMTIIVLGECVLGSVNAAAGVLTAEGWSWNIALVGLGGMSLVLSLWWMYFMLPSGEALHHHRERAWGWGYGHFFLFAAVAVMGAGLEAVADTLKALPAAGGPSGDVHAVSPTLAIGAVAFGQTVFILSLWRLWLFATRAAARQAGVVTLSLALLGAVVLAVHAGLPLPWALPLLTLGPVLLIVYNEHGRRHCTEHFSIR